MTEDLDPRLRRAFDDVRSLQPPDDTGAMGRVEARAHQRARRQRAGAFASLAVLIALAIAGATTTTDAADTVDANERIPVAQEPTDSTTLTVPAPTSSTTAKPESRPMAPTSKAQPPPTAPEPPPETTTTLPSWPEPHAAYVASKDREVKANQGSYCWSGGEGRSSLCADTVATWADDAPLLEVTSGDALLVRWETDDQPKRVKAIAYPRRSGVTDHGSGTELACDGGNPCRLLVGLAPGEYVLSVQSLWADGDVDHGVRLLVS